MASCGSDTTASGTGSSRKDRIAPVVRIASAPSSDAGSVPLLAGLLTAEAPLAVAAAGFTASAPG